MSIMKGTPTENEISNKTQGTYNPELDKFVGVELFPEKMAKAREMLKNTPLPPQLRDRQVK
ncbi:hypothetical protein [Dyadobacter sp. MSC1_007]|jgi:hypothetical protein|uniref:hypothetical protein n=1 Tax=Dyadobacter sp. MSC1_007 TaxID=2909264 RepID=UPI00202FDFE1|nr:hypothetical protein [Dyadobacter sp. MSC1_007]